MSSLTTALFEGALVSSYPSYYETKSGPTPGGLTLITKGGKPVAALIDIDLFEKIRTLRSQFEALTSDLGKAYKGTNKETAHQEINEALKKAKGK